MGNYKSKFTGQEIDELIESSIKEIKIGTVTQGITGSVTPVNSGNTTILNMVLPQGAQGIQGVKGDTGPTGKTGSTGATGPTGPQGPQGIQGPKGDTGSQGIQGPTGPKGDTGVAGATGKTGPQGAQGIQGVKGDTGPQGIAGAAAGFGTPTATIDGNIGTPSVTVTATGANTAKVFNFAFKNLKGTTGATGAKGDTGPAGPTGKTGPQGLQGPAGKDANSNYTLITLEIDSFNLGDEPLQDIEIRLITSTSNNIIGPNVFFQKIINDENLIEVLQSNIYLNVYVGENGENYCCKLQAVNLTPPFLVLLFQTVTSDNMIYNVQLYYDGSTIWISSYPK